MELLTSHHSDTSTQVWAHRTIPYIGLLDKRYVCRIYAIHMCIYSKHLNLIVAYRTARAAVEQMKKKKKTAHFTSHQTTA